MRSSQARFVWFAIPVCVACSGASDDPLGTSAAQSDAGTAGDTGDMDNGGGDATLAPKSDASGGSSSGGTSSSGGSSSGGSSSSSSSSGGSSPSGSGSSSGALSDGGVCGVPLKTGAPPSANFDLSHWELTLPTGAVGDPTIITTAQLTGGYTSTYFFTGGDGAMSFWAPVTGVTTANSQYPRSELREMASGKENNWSLTAGIATLSAMVTVTQVPPPSGKVVIGQIHAYGASDLPLIELAYKGSGEIVAEVLPLLSSTTQTDTTLASGIGLGECISYVISTSASAVMTISVNGKTGYDQPVDASWEAATFYFKAGDYVQANTGASADGAATSFYALSVSH